MSADCFPSFLNTESSLSIGRLLSLNCELLHLDSVEGRSVVLHHAELGVQLRRAELQALMLQHGDLLAHHSLAAPTVPRAGIAADGELRDLHAGVAENVWRFSLAWRESVSVISLSQPISRRLIK